MKACPFCAEDIQDAAIVCKHCGRDLFAKPEPPPPMAASAPEKKTHPLTVLILIGLVLGGIWFVTSIMLNPPTLSRAATEGVDPVVAERLLNNATRAGLLMKVEPRLNHAFVDPDLWAALTLDQKRAVAAALASRFQARGGPSFAHLYDGRTGKHLAVLRSYGVFDVD